MRPFISPKAEPASSVRTAPSTISAGEPLTSSEAMQLVSVITAPTERSRPPISTGTVWAMATKPIATASFEFWTSTAEEKPLGCRTL